MDGEIEVEFIMQKFAQRGNLGPFGYIVTGGATDTASDIKQGINTLLGRDGKAVPAYTVALLISGAIQIGLFCVSFETAPKIGRMACVLMGEGSKCALWNRKQHRAPECTDAAVTRVEEWK